LASDATNSSLIGSSAVGGVAAVVAAMRAHMDVAAVQERGCWVLSKLAIDDTNCTLIGSSAVGGVAAVVAAMRAHMGVAAVQQAGCKALFTLVSNNAANRFFVRSSGGLEAACASSALFAQNEAIQVHSSQLRSTIGHLSCGVHTFLSFASLDKFVGLIISRTFEIALL
jgi:hypothetical protein